LIETWLDILVLAAERMKSDEDLASRYEAEGLHPDEAMVAEHLGDYAAPESHRDCVDAEARSTSQTWDHDSIVSVLSSTIGPTLSYRRLSEPVLREAPG
jgi:hypothetical protein